MTVTRRQLLQASAGAAASVLFAHTSRATETTQADAGGFFTIGRRDGRWWFIDPRGNRSPRCRCS